LPEIARFYGLIIKMYFMQSEHNPPHFHALYGEYMGEFDINTLEMWNSQKIRKLPPLV